MANQSEHINELASSLAKCQGELTPAIKDSNNPFHKSKYADLNSVWSVCREPLSRNGLAVIQTFGKDEKGDIEIITTLTHCSGQWIRSQCPIPIKEELNQSTEPKKDQYGKIIKIYKNDPQALGSSITYMRRYCLSAIVGISTDDDDDGENAMNRNAKEEKTPKKEPPKEEAKPLTLDQKKPPKEEAEPLTLEQKKELHELSDLCDPEYMGKLFTYLENLGVKGFDALKSDRFAMVIKGMKSNAEMHQKGKG